MALFNSGPSWYSSVLSLGFASSIVLGLTDLASAKTFQVLVETGQTLPQNSEPIAKLIEPTIGRDRQVVVIIQHGEKVTVDPNFDTTSRSNFIGLNAISPTNQIQLVDSTASSSGLFSSVAGNFSAPSVSEGKIAYIKQQQVTASRGGPFAPDIEFKVGTATSTQTLNYVRVDRNYAANNEAAVAFVNGRAFLLDTGPFFTYPNNPNRQSTVERVDTRTTPIQSTVLITDVRNRAIRASADNLLLSQLDTQTGTNVYRLFEKPIDNGKFKEIFPLGQNSASCGFAASYKNVVACSSSSQGTILSVRLGQKSPFVAIPLPTGIMQVANPSISRTRVLFQGRIPNAGTVVDAIFLSIDGKAPQVMIKAGEQLNNKTITSLKLSNNGRAIADQSAVFLAGFSDGTMGLVRVDF